MASKLPWWTTEFGTRELELLREVIESNFVNDGGFTTRFENQLAHAVGSKYAVGVSSGTAALFCALAALDIGAGDEVLVPDLTFIASANAVKLAGAQVVLVDVDPHTLNIDPAAAERAITSRTKAIMPVHVSGRGADMPRILELARRSNLLVVEDAAESLVSRRFGTMLGTFGQAGCVSFSPNKLITTGQGGMVFTNDEALHIRLREIKDQGRPARGTGGDDLHPSVGFNFKLTNLQAAVGLAQLERLDARAKRMRDHYSIYSERLARIEEIEFPGFSVDEGETPLWVDIVTDHRDDLERYLAARHMECRKFWLPLHAQPPYRQPDHSFPVSTKVAPKALWLPSAFTLGDAEIHTICDSILAFFGSDS